LVDNFENLEAGLPADLIWRLLAQPLGLRRGPV
jgi:hypothetical protein